MEKKVVKIMEERINIQDKEQTVLTVTWTGTTWTIFGIILTFWATLFFGLCSYDRLYLWANILISFGIVVGAFAFLWCVRYTANMSIRWLDRQFTSKKTIH